jgi:hypothetical protein
MVAEVVLEAVLVAGLAHMAVWEALGSVQGIRTQLAQQAVTTSRVRWKRTSSVVVIDFIGSKINSLSISLLAPK